MLLIGIGGLPGAGKTTLLTGCPVPVVSLDDIRDRIVETSPQLADESINTLAWSLCDRDIRQHAEAGTPVIIVDAPHLLSHYRNRPANVLNEAHQTALIILHVSAADCLQRQHARGRVIDTSMWNHYCAAAVEYTEHPERWDSWDQHHRLSHTAARRRLHSLVNGAQVAFTSR